MVDYVTRRFNVPSAGLKKPVGLDLRWDRRFTRSPDSLGPRVSRSEAAVRRASRRLVPGSTWNWIAVNAVQQFSFNNNENNPS
jgi:hypothetical protein